MVVRRLADIDTPAYEPFDCAARCDNMPGCVGFNIFFERLPTLEPNLDFCDNPRATVRTGCTYWDGVIDITMASDVGRQLLELAPILKAECATLTLNLGPISMSPMQDQTGTGNTILRSQPLLQRPPQW